MMGQRRVKPQRLGGLSRKASLAWGVGELAARGPGARDGESGRAQPIPPPHPEPGTPVQRRLVHVASHACVWSLTLSSPDIGVSGVGGECLCSHQCAHMRPGAYSNSFKLCFVSVVPLGVGRQCWGSFPSSVDCVAAFEVPQPRVELRVPANGSVVARRPDSLMLFFSTVVELSGTAEIRVCSEADTALACPEARSADCDGRACVAFCV